jgi:hypothetical protein
VHTEEVKYVRQLCLNTTHSWEQASPTRARTHSCKEGTNPFAWDLSLDPCERSKTGESKRRGGHKSGMVSMSGKVGRVAVVGLRV